jgi:hypothetical protein
MGANHKGEMQELQKNCTSSARAQITILITGYKLLMPGAFAVRMLLSSLSPQAPRSLAQGGSHAAG